MLQPEAFEKTEGKAHCLGDGSEKKQVDQQGEPRTRAVMQSQRAQDGAPSGEKQEKHDGQINDVARYA